MNWSSAAVWTWGVLAAVIIGWELYCVLGGNVHTPPLTYVAVRYCPWWITMPFITWLFVHFAIRYANPEFIKKLRMF